MEGEGGGGADLLAEVENMATLQLFTLERSGGILPQEILVALGVLRCILVHSESYRIAHLAIASSLSSSFAEILEIEIISTGSMS